MFEIVKTGYFDVWLRNLKDQRPRSRIEVRIDRLASGNPGDVKPIGAGLSELRIDYGPGYRVYFKRRGRQIIVLLCGGDKSTQASDIKFATAIAAELE